MSDDLRHNGEPHRDAPGVASSEAAADRCKPDLQGLAREWIALWQSGLAAMAVDREAKSTWHTLLTLWTSAASAMQAATAYERSRGRDDGYGSGSGAAAAASGTATDSAPCDPRDAEIMRLARHVREIEGRLNDIEHGLRDGST
jgi:hypothetical protein